MFTNYLSQETLGPHWEQLPPLCLFVLFVFVSVSVCLSVPEFVFIPDLSPLRTPTTQESPPTAGYLPFQRLFLLLLKVWQLGVQRKCGILDPEWLQSLPGSFLCFCLHCFLLARCRNSKVSCSLRTTARIAFWPRIPRAGWLNLDLSEGWTEEDLR